jgi:hypothetical protein
MFRLVSSLITFGIFVLVIDSGAIAQPSPSVFSPAPFVDRGADKARIEQEKGAKKWASCRKEARAKKIKLMHRNKFMNDCVAN